MSDQAAKFGERLRLWRKDAGLTQEELAKRIGKTKSHISNIERAQPHPESGAPPRPSLEVVDKLARALGRTVTEMREAAGYGLPKREAILQEPGEDAEIFFLASDYKELKKLTPEEEQAEIRGVIRMVRGELARRLEVAKAKKKKK